MNHYQYDSLRAYAMEPLASYLGTPLAYDVARLSEKLSGGAARLEHEKSRAMEFWACPDLSPREKAAAHLLAVISNHRAISWWRAPDTPDGTDPLPALESWQEERLCKDTIDAAHAYAAFLPERQADALVALAPEPQHPAPATDTATLAPVVAGGLTKPHSSKLPQTLRFEEKVLELMHKFWNEKPLATEPTKGDLCKKVYDEILRTPVRGKRKTTLGMVIDAAKPWKVPIVLPASVPDSRFNDKRHPFKSEK